jgi:hypothetical protein
MWLTRASAPAGRWLPLAGGAGQAARRGAREESSGDDQVREASGA